MYSEEDFNTSEISQLNSLYILEVSAYGAGIMKQYRASPFNIKKCYYLVIL